MSAKVIRHYSLDALRGLKSETDRERVKAEPESSNASEIDIDWETAVIVEQEPKQMVSIRLDPDVLAFFKGEGRGYQTRMNAVLRQYMNARKAQD